jgi:hypothetical protein
MNDLFSDHKFDEIKKKKTEFHCRDCRYMITNSYSDKYHYCLVRKSGHTPNSKMKIYKMTIQCELFKLTAKL